MSQLPSRNGDELIQLMISKLHGVTYQMGDYTVDSIGPSTHGGRNTAITLTFNIGPQAGKTKTFYYYRLDVAQLIGAKNLEFPDSGYTSTRQLLPSINTALGLSLIEADLIDDPIAVGSYPAVVTLNAAPTSRVLFGSGTVTLASADSNVGTANFLFGYHNYTHSKEESFHLFGFDAIEGVTGEINGFNGESGNHSFTYGPLGDIPTAGGKAYLGSNKYIDDTNRPSYVVGFNVTDSGVLKVTGEFAMSDGTKGSEPIVAMTPEGRGYVVEVERGSATGAFSIKAVEVVGDAVVQFGNTFSGSLGVDVGMSYQTRGIKAAGVIDGHLIFTYKDEAGPAGNIQCAAYSFDGSDFTHVRSWSPAGPYGDSLRVVDGRLVGIINGATLVIFDYTAAAGPDEILNHDFSTLAPDGAFTSATLAGYDSVAKVAWVAMFDDPWENAALLPFQVDLQAGTVSALPRVNGLGPSGASPSVIYDNYLFVPTADWANFLCYRYNGTTLEQVGSTIVIPASTQFILPLTSAPA